MSMLILEGRTISVSGPFHGRASFRLARRGRVMGSIEAAWPVCWPNGRIDGAFAERNLPRHVFGRGTNLKMAVFSNEFYARFFLQAANETDGGRHRLHYLQSVLTEEIGVPWCKDRVGQSG